MSDLQPYSSQSLVSGGYQGAAWTKQGRAVAQIASSAELEVVRTAAATYVERARLDALDMVAQRGLQSVAMVSQLEQQLSTMVPFVASRLQAIGDMHAFAVANEVLGFGKRV